MNDDSFLLCFSWESLLSCCLLKQTEADEDRLRAKRHHCLQPLLSFCKGGRERNHLPCDVAAAVREQASSSRQTKRDQGAAILSETKEQQKKRKKMFVCCVNHAALQEIEDRRSATDSMQRA